MDAPTDVNDYLVSREELCEAYGLTRYRYTRWRTSGLSPARYGDNNTALFRVVDVWNHAEEHMPAATLGNLLAAARFAARRLDDPVEEAPPKLSDAVRTVMDGGVPDWLTPAEYARVLAGMHHDARRRALEAGMDAATNGHIESAELEAMGLACKGAMERHLAEDFWAVLATAGADYDAVRDRSLTAMDAVVMDINDHIEHVALSHPVD